MQENKYRRYGYCSVTDRWVPRDSMVGATFKTYNRDGSESRIPIRLSASGMAELRETLSRMEWRNHLLTAEEMSEEQFGKVDNDG